MNLQMPQTKGRTSRAAEPEVVFDETGLQVGPGSGRPLDLLSSKDTNLHALCSCVSCSAM